MAAAADGGLGCVAGAGQGAVGRRARRASHARPPAASGALAVVCWSAVSVEKWRWSMFAAFCAVHDGGGEAVRERDGVGVGVRAQERVLDGLVRARCVVVLRVRLAGGRVVERGCRRGAMGQRGGGFFLWQATYYKTLDSLHKATLRYAHSIKLQHTHREHTNLQSRVPERQLKRFSHLIDISASGQNSTTTEFQTELDQARRDYERRYQPQAAPNT